MVGGRGRAVADDSHPKGTNVSVDMVKRPNVTLIEGVEHLVLRDGSGTKPLFRIALGLIGPDQSITSGWTYLPEATDQLRYLREHYSTKGGRTVYKPVVLLQMLEDIYSDGAAYGNIMAYRALWSDLDEEAFDNGNWVSEAIAGVAPATRQMSKRPMHQMMGIDIGKCLQDCGRILDAKRDNDVAICTPCWEEM